VAQQVKVLEGDALKPLAGESRPDNNSNGTDFE
jgi:exodeoxyribonuclease VII small subunit